jgi:ammonium transporter, Amt family
MMVVHKRSRLFQQVDDTLGVFHTHAVAGFLGGVTTGLFTHLSLFALFLPVSNSRGAFYGNGMHAVREASRQRALHHQLERGGHDPGVPRRATAHARRRAGQRRRGARRGGVCAVWGDGEKYDSTKHGGWYSDNEMQQRNKAPSGVTQNV